MRDVLLTALVRVSGGPLRDATAFGREERIYIPPHAVTFIRQRDEKDARVTILHLIDGTVAEIVACKPEDPFEWLMEHSGKNATGVE